MHWNVTVWRLWTGKVWVRPEKQLPVVFSLRVIDRLSSKHETPPYRTLDSRVPSRWNCPYLNIRGHTGVQRKEIILASSYLSVTVFCNKRPCPGCDESSRKQMHTKKYVTSLGLNTKAVPLLIEVILPLTHACFCLSDSRNHQVKLE